MLRMTFQDFVFQVADFMGKIIIYNYFFFTVTISDCRNPEKMFFCSICYKSEELRIKSIPAPHELKGNSDSIAQDQNEHDDLNAGGNKKPSNPGRCFQCNKKIIVWFSKHPPSGPMFFKKMSKINAVFI